jgi:hypothetical protein
MHVDYKDIIERAGPPDWYDANGTPRYGVISPRAVTVYADVVVASRIACQACSREFTVVVAFDDYHICLSGVAKMPLPKRGDPPSHYGDPPAHGCVGDTMNCDDLYVIDYWRRHPGLQRWTRARRKAASS